MMMLQEAWLKKICESYLKPPVYHEGKRLPRFPSEDIQINTTGQRGINTLKEAFVFYNDCIKTFNEIGTPLNPRHKLLDFGVGWGRIARFFLRDLPMENIYGIDVMEDFVKICLETFESDNFYVCKSFPPISIPSGKMNFVVGYSIFSHLSENACYCWMKEFHRILDTDGIVALTTRGRWFFDFCENLKGRTESGYLSALSQMFHDFADARARYDRGEFVHSNAEGVTGGGAMTADFYGETFIPEEYARGAYAGMFTLERFISDPSGKSHPIMFFRRV
jgi:hypothetical protein